jgi:thiol-disulfide isomerase/thioredoxin
MLNTLALALFAALSLPLSAQEPKPAPKPPVESPKPADPEKKPEPLKLGGIVDENLSLPDLDGKTWKMKDLRGKVVFIHFWSIRCPSEPPAEPKFRALMKLYEKQDVVHLAILSNQNELDFGKEGDPPGSDHKKVREHVKEKGMPYPILIDRGNRVSDYFGAKSTPHCFVIDKKGALAYQGALDDDPKGEKGQTARSYISEAIDDLLAGKEVALKETRPYG